MGPLGLEPVAHVGAMFVSDRAYSSGVNFGITVMLEGTRPILVEVQALCIHSKFVRPVVSQTVQASCADEHRFLQG